MRTSKELITNEGLRAEAKQIAERFLDLTVDQHGEGFLTITSALKQLRVKSAHLSRIAQERLATPIQVEAEEALDKMRERARSIFLGKGEVTIRWSKRPTFQRLGVIFPNGTKRYPSPLIEVSSMLKADGCHEEALDTLAHEIAHWIALAVGRVGRGHGPIWKAVAEVCGGEGAATRLLATGNSPAVDAEVARLRGPGFTYSCSQCGHVESFSKARHRKVEDHIEFYGGVGPYSHTKCGGVFMKEEEEN